MELIYKEAGKRIFNLRKQQGMTREKLAEKAHVTSKFIYEVEAGRKGFSAATLFEISKALSVKCDYILSGEEEKQSADLGATLSLFGAEDAVSLNNLLLQLYAFLNNKKNSEE